MNIEQAYDEFLMLVNRNATNNNANVDFPRFVLLYNDIEPKYVQWVLEKRNEDDIRYVQQLSVPEVSLSQNGLTTLHTKFALPQDYFDFENIHVTATKGCCDSVRILPFEVKTEDVEELLEDPNNTPSFEYRETFYYIASGNVCVFHGDFNISKVLLTYYRYPRQVDIAGYIHLDGTASTSIDPELDDKAVRRVLLGMSRTFSANNEDAVAYQIDKDRLFTIN